MKCLTYHCEHRHNSQKQTMDAVVLSRLMVSNVLQWAVTRMDQGLPKIIINVPIVMAQSPKQSTSVSSTVNGSRELVVSRRIKDGSRVVDQQCLLLYVHPWDHGTSATMSTVKILGLTTSTTAWNTHAMPTHNVLTK